MLEYEMALHLALACKPVIESFAINSAISENEAQRIIFDILDADAQIRVANKSVRNVSPNKVASEMREQLRADRDNLPHGI